MPDENFSSQIFVISGPSGVGKDTIANAILERIPCLVKPVTYTTRPSREGDRPNGEEYFFISDPEFKALMGENEVIAWAQIHGHLYGIPRSEIERLLSENKNILLVIDVNGGINIKKAYAHTTLIFVKYESLDQLKNRLQQSREDITEKEIEIRFNTAQNEITFENQYDYSIINPEGRPEVAIQAIESLIIDKLGIKSIDSQSS